MVAIALIGWIILFKDHESIREIGTALLASSAGILSTIHLYKTFQKISTKERYFWLLLSIGTLFYTCGNIYWIIKITTHGIVQSSELSYVLSLAAYSFFLYALIHKIKYMSHTTTNDSFIFNIVIFMLCVATISIHFSIKPIAALSNDSIFVAAINILFTITDLSILFGIISLFYQSQKSRAEEKLIHILMVGFLLQLTGDLLHTYVTAFGKFHIGIYTEIFWVVSVLFIGFASFYAKEETIELDWLKDKPMKNRETLIPYISVLVLLILVIDNYKSNLNTLSYGAIIVFLTILGRQYFIMRKNRSLMHEYKVLAYHDPLTGLNNRASFKHDMSMFLEKANRFHYKAALLLIDLDRFKNINDSLGHHAGDIILKKVSERLKQSLTARDRIYRLGGDEFVIILPNASKRRSKLTSEKILKTFVEPFIVEGHEIMMTPSIGISLFPDNGKNDQTLLKHADAAMYLAKGNGRNHFQFFSAALNDTLSRKMNIENGLRKAIENNQLQLYYQPKVELQTGNVIGMEALLRWNHPELGFVSPMEFIPIAEETGQIVSIGEWVLKTACQQNKTWQESGFPSLCVSVNVSVRQFRDQDFIKMVSYWLQQTGLHPQFLEIEITESVMHERTESTKVLSDLKKLGVNIAIDDFGTGYSSLYILKELPIDTLKIDKAFISNISDHANRSMLKTIIEMGNNFNLKVVAEGVEHEHQVSALTEYKCDYGQGYLFSKPLPATDFDKWIELNQPQQEFQNIAII